MRRMDLRFCGAFWLLSLVFCLPVYSAPPAASLFVPPSLTPNPLYEKRIAELEAQIDEKNKLLEEWIAWKQKETTLRQELEQAYEDQIRSRDLAIEARDNLIKSMQAQLDDEKHQNIQDVVIVGVSALVVGFATGGLGILIAFH